MSTLERPGPAADVAKEVPLKGCSCDNRTVSLFHVYSGNHHTCSYNFFVLLFCSLEYISITMRSNENLTTQV